MFGEFRCGGGLSGCCCLGGTPFPAFQRFGECDFQHFIHMADRNDFHVFFHVIRHFLQVFFIFLRDNDRFDAAA